MPKKPFPLAALLTDLAAAARARRPAKSPGRRRRAETIPVVSDASEGTGEALAGMAPAVVGDGPWCGFAWRAGRWELVARAEDIGAAHRLLLSLTSSLGLASAERVIILGRVPEPPGGSS
jgi:hypothetical protein